MPTLFQFKDVTWQAIKEGLRLLVALLISTAVTFIGNYLVEFVIPTLSLSPEYQGILIMIITGVLKSYDRGVHESEATKSNGFLPSL